MSISEYFNPKKTNKLFGLKKEFQLLKNLIENNELPKVLLLSGEKGSGKFTLINHLLNFYFDRVNYDQVNYSFDLNSKIFKQNFENIFSNIIHLEGAKFKNINIEEIRSLKKNLSKSSINNEKRFIILDDVEIFNENSVNALLKLIEEPNEKNYFIIINNKARPLLETIKSRSIEIKIFLKDQERRDIIMSLFNYFELNLLLKKEQIIVSPGNLIKFNYVMENNKIDLENNFLTNLKTVLKLYNKEKDIFFKDLILFMTEYFYLSLKNKKKENLEKIALNRSLILRSINQFFIYNINQNTLINSLEKNIE